MPYKNPEDRKAYVEANREHLRELNNQYSAANREKRRESANACYERDKEKRKARSREYYAKNAERISKARSDPKQRYREGKRSAKGRGYEWRITLEEYIPLLSQPCHYCEGPLNVGGGGLDRKDNEPYYAAGNVVPCCKKCNVTFLDNYNYQEKLIIAPALKRVREEAAMKLHTGYGSKAETTAEH